MPLLVRRSPSTAHKLLARSGELTDRLPDELTDRVRAPTPAEARVALAALRLAFGAGWLAPNAVARAFGIDADGQPAVAMLGRLFAARDAVLGAVLLEAEGEELDRWLCYGAVLNSADVAAALLAGLRRRLSWRSALTVAAVAGTGVYLGVTARRG